MTSEEKFIPVFIIPALQYIEQKNYNKALIVYRDYTLKLKTKYGS